MKTMTAANAKNAFGQLIEAAQREPVLITKQNRPVGVFISIRDLEDRMSGEEALLASVHGSIGEDASRKLIEHLLRKAES